MSATLSTPTVVPPLAIPAPVAVARIHGLGRWVWAMPWLIMLASLAVNVVVWAGLHGQEDYNGGTGGLASLYVSAFFFLVGSFGQVFPFAVGLGVTRRAYEAGTVLAVGLYSVVTGAVLTLLAWIEGITDGFGLQGKFFRVPWLVDGTTTWQQPLVFAVPMLAIGGLALFFSGLYARYRTLGVQLVAVVGVAVAAIAAVVITRMEWWPAVGSWFADQTPLTVTGYAAVVAALALAGGHLTLRRAPV